ncbi:MAG: hypothetical protein R8G66_22460 [Cytophagales bacterium]|nr:hypothetical protein [Cytophagales bacterium]
MKKVTPYKTTKGAIASLDNGGRFYNLASRANDGEITHAELAKAAGVVSDTQKIITYLELSLDQLESPAKQEVMSHLSNDLRHKYNKHLPQRFLPSEAAEHAQVATPSIITGIPRLVESKSEFTGFIMIPISTGSVTTFVMVPIIDQYDVYELRDQSTDETFFVAHARSRKKLPEQMVSCGGVIKELKADKKEKVASRKYLEISHYAIH